MSNKQDIYLQMYHNMGLLICEKSENYQKYKKVRKLHEEVMNSMSAYIMKYDCDPEEILNYADIQDDFGIDLSEEEINHLYIDMITYPYTHKVSSLTEIYLDTHKFRKEEKVEMLEAMKQSRLGVYEFVSRDQKNAISMIRHVITREEIPLTDSSLGEIPESMDGYNFVLRVIHYQDIYFQTGMIMLLKKNNVTRSWYKSQRKNMMADEQLDFLVNLIDFYQRLGIRNRVMIRSVK